MAILLQSSSIARFRAVPWCAAFIDSNNGVLFTPTCRRPDGEIGGTKDKLFRKTLNSPDSIPHALGIFTDPAETWSSKKDETSDSQSLYIQTASVIFEVHQGINGFNGTVHGGLISALIDEGMGSLIYINHVAQTTMEGQGHEFPSSLGALDLHNKRAFTASMNVVFKKPLPTPSVVIVTARQTRIDGRKIYIDVRVCGENDVEYASCDGMWIAIPQGKM